VRAIVFTNSNLVPKLIPPHEDGMASLRSTVALVTQRDFGPNAGSPA
jgi:hypothetical protein